MIPKPQNCDQDWLSMQKVERGRICGKCQNLMTDFTKIPWSEIERKHTETPGQVCGMYSQKQLDHWGREVPSVFSKCSKSAVMLTSMFAALNFQPMEAKPLEISGEEIHFSPTEWGRDTVPKKIDKTTNPLKITGTISGNGEPLIGANVILKNRQIGTVANVDGQFVLEIPDSIKVEDRILEISYLGFATQEVDFSTTKANAENVIELKKQGVLTNEGVYITNFVIRKPTRWQRFKHWFKNIFR